MGTPDKYLTHHHIWRPKLGEMKVSGAHSDFFSLYPSCQPFLITWQFSLKLERLPYYSSLYFIFDSVVAMPLLYPPPNSSLPQSSFHFEHRIFIARLVSFTPPNSSRLLKWNSFPLLLQPPEFFSLLHLPSQAHSRNNSPLNCRNVPQLILKIFNCICHKYSNAALSHIGKLSVLLNLSPKHCTIYIYVWSRYFVAHKAHVYR